MTLSHIIINSTLVRADNSEFILASYAIAMSLFGITERLGNLLRQTCSSLVRDRTSYQLILRFSFYLIFGLMLIAIGVAYTPVGDFIFSKIFGAKVNMVDEIKEIYQVLIFVTIFSASRCVAQGVIIYNRQTKWLTIGMVIRIAAMYLLSLYFIQSDQITGTTGAIIFLLGMMIECLISIIEARKLVRKMPEKHEEQQVESKTSIFKFYSPLMFSSVIVVMIGPAINVSLGKTDDIELAIASYAIAMSVTQLVLSFFMFIHQIVINFYGEHNAIVKKFLLVIGFIPFILIAILSYTPLGGLFFEHVLGVEGRLLDASVQVLKVTMLMALVFPFVDFYNGLLMYYKQTKITIFSQSANLIVTLIALVIGVNFASQWNGIIGGIGISLGLLAELIVVSRFIYAIERKEGKATMFPFKRLSTVEKNH
ncbi:hypothetical protein [Bacillus timonensis]|uniref:hypothetical protein n=1 Tax=Bacillus timonensis TaxID=1033734 RepID=UPI0002893C40|nr:hypothetical protein [Bacillus timonensis]